MKLRRVRPANINDTDFLRKLYDKLDSCNARSNQVERIINETQAAIAENNFQRITLVAEELKPTGNFQPESTASFFYPPQCEEGLSYYAHRATKLELAVRPIDFIEFGALVSEPNKKGYSKLLTPARALLARTLFESGLLKHSNVLIEFLPESYQTPTGQETNSFWQDLILPRLIQNDTLNILAEDLECETNSIFDNLRRINFVRRNQIIQRYFPREIPTTSIHMPFVNIQSPAAKIAIERIYNLRTLGYFPVDGGLNSIAHIKDGFTGERTVPFEATTLPDSDLTESAIIFDPENPYVLWQTKGIWTEDVAVIPSQVLTLLEPSSNVVTFRRLPI